MGPSKSWKWRWSKLVQKIERVHHSAERARLIQELCLPPAPTVLAFVNAHAMNLLVRPGPLFDGLVGADLLLRDGTGMETLFNQLHIRPGFNLNGTDLIPDVVSQFNGRCIALFGTQEPYLQRATQFVGQQLAPDSPCIQAHGFLDTDAYIALAREHRPALIVLGMGMPRQEEVAMALRSGLDVPCLIICGGAIIDFWGGKTSRAPLWMRRSGIEWAYRLRMEPQRLFQRYVVGNLVFLLRIFVFSMSNARIDQQNVNRKDAIVNLSD